MKSHPVLGCVYARNHILFEDTHTANYSEHLNLASLFPRLVEKKIVSQMKQSF